MTKARGLVLATILAVSTGCAGFYVAPVIPPPGMLYAQFSSAIDIDADQTKVGKRVGRSYSESFVGLFARGDASIRAAAKDGGITTLRHVDYEFENYLGIYSKFTVVVYGD